MTEERRPQHGDFISLVKYLEEMIAALRREVQDTSKHMDDKINLMESRNLERFRASESSVSAALAAADKAVDKAEINAEKWRSNANEWRAAMSDRERNFYSRTEAEIAIKAIEEKISDLKKSRDVTSGNRETSGLVWEKMLSILAILIALSSFIYIIISGHK